MPVDHEQEHKERLNLYDYKSRLIVQGQVLPDPFTLEDGWLGEVSMTQWPSLYFVDIVNYLKIKTATELYNRLCNEYKQGKAYR